MATPEVRAEEALDLTPDLRVIQGGGGLALEQTVLVTPVHELPLPEFQAAVHGLIKESEPDKSPEDLLQIRSDLEAVRTALSDQSGALAIKIHELTQQFDEITRKKIWVNGYLNDPKNFS